MKQQLQQGENHPSPRRIDHNRNEDEVKSLETSCRREGSGEQDNLRGQMMISLGA